MPERIDVLGPGPERLAVFRGRLLDNRPDEVLDAITREAAAELHAPVSAVTLVLERLQLVRASHGLGETGVPGIALDRDLSICQYVVRDRTIVEINDATLDARVAEATVRDFKVGAYLGAPVSVGDEVVGALCIVDPAPRQFDAKTRAILSRHADKVSARLAELAAEQRGSDSAAELLRAATRPAFQDLRNALWQLSMSLDQVGVASFEARQLSLFAGATVTLADGTPGNLAILSGAMRAAAALQDLAETAQEQTRRLQRSVLALEAATQRSGLTADLGAAVVSATRLAEHFLKLVGGVEGAPPAGITVDMPASAIILQVGTTLSILAQALHKARVNGRLRISIEEGPGTVSLRVSTPGGGALHQSAADTIRELLGAAGGVAVTTDDASLMLLYRLAPFG